MDSGNLFILIACSIVKPLLSFIMNYIFKSTRKALRKKRRIGSLLLVEKLYGAHISKTRADYFPITASMFHVLHSTPEDWKAKSPAGPKQTAERKF